jgi:hypothetical protein
VVEKRAVKSSSASTALDEAKRLVGTNASIAGIEIRKGGRLDRKVWLGRSIKGENLNGEPDPQRAIGQDASPMGMMRHASDEM